MSRWYGLLLRAYPRGPRRAEMLGTLLETGGPGLPGSVNLVIHGLRARLGRPSSHAIVVLALLVAVVGGFAAAAGGYRLAWEAAPALPTGAEADAITRTVLPGLKVWGGGDAPVFVPASDGDGTERGASFYWTRHTAETKDIARYTAGARDRLAAAGWTITKDVTAVIEPDLVTPTDESTFQATRGDLILQFDDFYWHDRASYDSDGGATFTLTRAYPPAGVRAGAVLAGLLGALIGWLLTGWISRRTRITRVRSGRSGPAPARSCRTR